MPYWQDPRQTEQRPFQEISHKEKDHPPVTYLSTQDPGRAGGTDICTSPLDSNELNDQQIPAI